MAGGPSHFPGDPARFLVSLDIAEEEYRRFYLAVQVELYLAALGDKPSADAEVFRRLGGFARGATISQAAGLGLLGFGDRDGFFRYGWRTSWSVTASTTATLRRFRWRSFGFHRPRSRHCFRRFCRSPPAAMGPRASRRALRRLHGRRGHGFRSGRGLFNGSLH